MAGQEYLIDIVDTQRFRVTVKAQNAEAARDLALARFGRRAGDFALVSTQTDVTAEPADYGRFRAALLGPDLGVAR